MKKILTIVTLWLVLLPVAWSQTDWGKELPAALQARNSAALARYMGEGMEVSILGTTGVMSAAQTRSLLEAFMAEHEPQSCMVSHQGMREMSSFFIISYIDKQGKTYRIYIVVRKEEQQQYIKQFRIDYVK